MRAICKRTLVLLLVLFFVSNSSGSELKFDIHTDIESQAISLIKDKIGYFWIGTLADGVYRYDGKTLKHYSQNSPLILGNAVPCIHEDKEGNLWFTATGGGVTKLERKQNKIHAFKSGSGGLSSASFYWSGKQICLQSQKGDIWIGTTGGGLNRIRNNGEIQYYKHHGKDEHSLSNNNVRVLHEGKDGSLWIGTEKGLDRYNPSLDEFEHYRSNPSQPSSLSGAIVISILEDSSGSIWVGTESRGLNRLDRKSGKFEHFRHQVTDENSIGADRISFLWEGNNGEIWCSHENHLSIYHPRSNNFTRHRIDVTSVVRDESGEIWCLFDEGQLGRLRQEKPRFRHYKHDPKDKNSLAAHIVVTIYEDSKKDLWISSLGGFTRFNRFTNTYTRYHYDAKDPSSIPSTINYSPGIYEHSDGTFYIGTAMPATVCIFDRTKGVVTKRYLHDPKKPKSMPDASQVNMFLEDADDKNILWLATAKAVIRFNRTTESFDTMIESDSWGVYDDGNGYLWATTWGKGVARLHKKSGKVDFLSHSPDDDNSVSGNVTVPIFRASDGRIWVGANNGLNLLDVSSGTFKRYSYNEGYHFNSIHSIGEDEKGNLWLGTAGGLGRFEPATGKARIYTKEDGVQASMFYALNGIRTEDGQMWFGGVKGMNSFFPDSLKDNPHKPSVRLTSFTQGGAEFPTSSSPELLKKVVLDWTNNFFEFEFVAFDYTNPKQNLYAYKLDGLDKTYFQSRTRNYGRYSAIPPGIYTLCLQGSNNDGVWNKKGQSIVVEVLPPFWQTNWFKAFIALLMLMVSCAIVFYVTKLRREIAQREKAEAALRASRDNLEELNRELKRLDELKDEFLANTSHELRTPLNGIIGLAEALLDGVAGQLPEGAKRDLNMVVASGRRLASLVNDILDFSKLRHHDLELQIKPIDLATAVEVVLAVSRATIGGKDVKLSSDLSSSLPAVAADENRIQQILYNLVGNAIKFTHEGEIKVLAKEEDECVSVTVMDTGIGIPADRLESIFVPFEQVDGSTARKYGGTGLGLSVTKQLVQLHGGDIRVESKEGEGTKFVFTLKKSKDKAQQLSNFSSKNRVMSSVLFSEEGDIEPVGGIFAGKVLVVDDEAVNLRVLKNQLRLQNYDVTVANNGHEALEAISKSKFDIVLLDIMMPGMTGYEVCKKLREDYGQDELPVVLVTAKNRVQDLVYGFNSGANDYLSKPFTRGELIARVETHLQIKNLFSERVEAERELLRMEEQLLQAQKMEAIGTLAAGIAHDFNNLLQGILGYTQLLMEESGHENKNELAHIEQASLRAAELIRDLLTFSRKEKAELEVLDLSSLILSSKKLLERTLPKMVDITVSLDKNLNIINGDSQHLEQVLLNLATNACDAMDGSGEISIKAENVTLNISHPKLAAGQYVRICISDTGKGIDEETQRHMYDPFFTTKGVGKGTGLGLSTVFGIVVNHGGAIDCKSTVGKGTTFSILLPAEVDEKAAELLKEEQAISYPGGKETILLVDDEELVLGVSSRFLERLGYEVLIARTGEQCLDTLEKTERPVDLIILDVGMPGMGGKVCSRTIQKKYPKQKVVIATGYGGLSAGENASSLGALALISKPFDLETLAKSVRQALED